MWFLKNIKVMHAIVFHMNNSALHKVMVYFCKLFKLTP